MPNMTEHTIDSRSKSIAKCGRAKPLRFPCRRCPLCRCHRHSRCRCRLGSFRRCRCRSRRRRRRRRRRCRRRRRGV